MGNSSNGLNKLKIETKDIDLMYVRSREIEKAEIKMKDYVTRLFNRKIEYFVKDYEKKIGKMADVENEYIILATRISRLERMLECGKVK